MHKITPILVIVFLTFTGLQAQNITGILPQHAGQQLKLVGFDNYNTVVLDSAVVDAAGNFNMKYTANYKGMGVLQTQDKSSLVLVLNEPNIQLIGTHLKEVAKLKFTNSSENLLFVEYANQQAQRQNALVAWRHLLPLYKNAEVLKSQQQVSQSIQAEMNRLQQEDTQFITNLEKGSYLKWFIPIRTLVSEMPATVRRYTERIPENIAQFRNIDFNNSKFKNSGILKEVLEGHYMLLENMGQSMDSIANQMNRSSDFLIENLSGNESLLNTLGEHLFNYLEKRSLYTVSAHLAVQLLSQNTCKLEAKFSNKLEAYRKMKVGTTAPDISFLATQPHKGAAFNKNTTLSGLKNTYTLLVFGASWCTACVEELPKIQAYYTAWKAKGVEVVFVSLDTDSTLFASFTQPFSWLSYSDLKGWQSDIAKNYYVFATPTMYLLDSNRKILVRPNSVAHANAWISQRL